MFLNEKKTTGEDKTQSLNFQVYHCWLVGRVMVGRWGHGDVKTYLGSPCQMGAKAWWDGGRKVIEKLFFLGSIA